jgi:hypothetical protein
MVFFFRFLTSPPPGWNFAEAVSRFNANVSYSGLTHAVTQEVRIKNCEILTGVLIIRPHYVALL